MLISNLNQNNGPECFWGRSQCSLDDDKGKQDGQHTGYAFIDASPALDVWTSNSDCTPFQTNIYSRRKEMAEL